MSFLMGLDPIKPQQIGQKTLYQKMAPKDSLGQFPAFSRQRYLFAVLDLYITLSFQPTQCFHHRWRRYTSLIRYSRCYNWLNLLLKGANCPQVIFHNWSDFGLGHRIDKANIYVYRNFAS